ncbi:hypothetical protein LTR08_000458 [Meristemomyces frigidus]|nr:hypothetical protein LTR08_000458 [Meristemomyces frigidus]
MSTADELVARALEIIGEAISLEPDDLQDHETWKFLGLGDLLATATAADLDQSLDLHVPADVFDTCPTVGDFKAYLRNPPSASSSSAAANGATKPAATNGSNATPAPPTASATKLEPLPPIPANPWEGIPKPKVPLAVILQGKPETATTTIFLFPDGSGAGTAYGSLPLLGENICLVGLNSPFLRQASSFTCSIEHMARLWVDEVRRLQPPGKKFVLGGWSAGGYYAFEVAKLLDREGERVERLILIDSPCRLEFEALPSQVVGELTRKGLMGASGERKAPEWLIQHFTSTVLSVEHYMPTPLPKAQMPKYVNFMWVREGLVKSVAESGLNVDLSVKVTRFLLEPRGELKTVGWEKLLPGARYKYDYVTGNHFQITQPPHVSFLLSREGEVGGFADVVGGIV